MNQPTYIVYLFINACLTFNFPQQEGWGSSYTPFLQFHPPPRTLVGMCNSDPPPKKNKEQTGNNNLYFVKKACLTIQYICQTLS